MTQLTPNSRVAEQVILSHILLNKPKVDSIFNRISIDMFYSNDYKMIYKSICEVRKKNIEINLHIVINHLTNHQESTED